MSYYKKKVIYKRKKLHFNKKWVYSRQDTITKPLFFHALVNYENLS